MARKSDSLTSRQRQSQRIVREKAAMKRRKELLRKAQYIGAALSVVLGLTGGVWVWKHNIIEKAVAATTSGAYQMTVNAGFELEFLYLEGRNRTAMGDIEKALGVKEGGPILQLSLAQTREKLEAIPSIKSAAVERALPSTLYVRIVEREPVALWQNQGKIVLVDDKGVVMNGIDSAPYMKLPLIVGVGAPQHVEEILTILASAPELSNRFVAAVRVGDRRWNIRLNEGVEVKLPEKNSVEAWKKLAELQAHQQLLDRDVRVIDLRAPGKLFIKLSPEDMLAKTAGAKET